MRPDRGFLLSEKQTQSGRDGDGDLSKISKKDRSP